MALFTLDTLLKNEQAFIKIFSQYYSIPANLLQQYSHVWDWDRIVENKKIAWSIDLIVSLKKILRQSNRLKLVSNTSLPWSKELIELLINERICKWEDLKVQEKIIQDPSLLTICLPEWSKTPGPYDSHFGGGYYAFRYTSWGENAKEWTYEVVENCDNLRWDWLSEIKGFPWTAAFIEKHKDKLNWQALSRNAGLPWSFVFIQQFEVHWKWEVLPLMRFPWDIQMLETFKDKPIWKSLSQLSPNEDGSPFIYWTEEVLERFSDKIWWATPSTIDDDWEGIMRSTSVINSDTFIWTPQLFNKVNENVKTHFKLLEKVYGEEGVNFKKDKYWTFYCNTNNWSLEFFEFLHDKGERGYIKTINWKNIVRYAVLLWTDQFIEKYFYKIKELIANDRYAEYLYSNIHFPWNKYVNQLKDLLNEKNWLQLHKNSSFKPDIQILEQYKDTWSSLDWEQLSKNIPLDIKLIEKFENKFNFIILSSNPSITATIVKKYINKPWNWHYLLYKEVINWDRIWEEEDINKIDLSTWPYFSHDFPMAKYANDQLLEQFLQMRSKEN